MKSPFKKAPSGHFASNMTFLKIPPTIVFVDKLSGKPLFDTQDRFNSGTGWLSFTQPVAGSVTYHRDLSHGMVRTEIRSKSSGIHLGHVFENEGQIAATDIALMLKYWSLNPEINNVFSN